MTVVNWPEFEAKFGAGMQVAFERMAYLIFCKMHKEPYGLFRYRNHPATETVSVSFEGKVVGFQAKYWRSDLGCRLDDFKEAIDKVRKHDTRTNELVFFLPSDFNCNSQEKDDGLKTKTQRLVEQYAQSRGLALKWFCDSNFEVTFADEEYDSWGRHFFSREREGFDAVAELDALTRETLSGIRNAIRVKGDEIVLDRQEVRNGICKAGENTIVIVSGAGGVGKTAVLKEIYNQWDAGVFWLLRPQEVVSLLSRPATLRNWRVSIEDVLRLCSDCEKKMLVVDSAEKIPMLGDDSAIFTIVDLFRKSGWQIVFTVRSLYVSRLQGLLAIKLHATWSLVRIESIPEVELGVLAEKYGYELPNRASVKELLRVPFYLDIYLSHAGMGSGGSLPEFRNEIWRVAVENSSPTDSAGRTFCEIIRQKILSDAYSIDVSAFPPKDVATLIEREILLCGENTAQLRVAHDVFEEMAIDRIIEKAFVELPLNEFENRVVCSYAYRRSYRSWIADKVNDGDKRVRDLLVHSLSSGTDMLKRETLFAMTFDDVCQSFLTDYCDVLLGNKAELFCAYVQVVYYLRRKFDGTFVEQGLPRSTPEGDVWERVIEFVRANITNSHIARCKTLLCLLREWCLFCPESPGAKVCVDIAIAYYKKSEMDCDGSRWYIKSEPLAELLLAAGTVAFDDIKEVIDPDINDQDGRISAVARALCDLLLVKPWGDAPIAFIKKNPKAVLDLAERRWRPRPRRHTIWDSYSSHQKAECAFGLDESTSSEYIEPSAYQTPLYLLLKVAPEETYVFILKMVNDCVVHAAKSEMYGFEETTFTFSEEKKVTQYISESLWTTHRLGFGPVLPNLFKCIHMALERHLLDVAKHEAVVKSSEFRFLLRCLIFGSKSASITSVVTSVVLAHPEELFDVALVLFTSREAFACDYLRSLNEGQWRQTSKMFAFRKTLHSCEREKSDEEEFRKVSLEGVAEHYQLYKFVGQDGLDEKVRAIIDSLFPDKEHLCDADQFFLRRVDTRYQTFKECIDEKTGKPAILIEPRMTKHLADKQAESVEFTRRLSDYFKISEWGEQMMKGVKRVKKSFAEDPEARTVADLIVELSRKEVNKEDYFLCRKCVIYAALAMICHYGGSLSRKCRKCCQRVLSEGWSRLNALRYNFQIGDGVVECILAAPYVMEYDFPWIRARKMVEYVKAFENRRTVDLWGYDRICDAAYISVRNYGSRHPEFVEKMIRFYEVKRTVPLAEFHQDVLNMIPVECCGNSYVCDVIKRGVREAFGDIYKTDKNGEEVRGHYHAFARKYSAGLANWILHAPVKESDAVLHDLLGMPDVFSNSDFLSDLIVSADADDSLTVRFWHVWEELLPIVSAVAHSPRRGSEHERCGMVCEFFLAHQHWKPEADKWKHFSAANVVQFSKMVETLCDVPFAARGVVEFMSSVGKEYQANGITWLAKILSAAKFDNYFDEDLLRHIKDALTPIIIKMAADGSYKSAQKAWRNDLLIVLDFLVTNHSVEAFYVRELVLT